MATSPRGARGSGRGSRGARRRRPSVRRARPSRQPPSRREAANARFTDLAGSGFLLEDAFDLARVRETTCLLLGEEQLVVDSDLEDSSGALDELRLDPELLLDLLRQTGGAGVVVSDAAVLDNDRGSHKPPPFGGIIPPAPLVSGSRRKLRAGQETPVQERNETEREAVD
jgi:hypothetical protein